VNRGPLGISKHGRFVHHRGIPGIPVDHKSLGIHMRKVALLAAVVLAAAFSTKADVALAQSGAANPNANTEKLLRDAMNPGAVAQPSAPKKAMKAKRSKKKK
jgi:hypothetical protein